MMHGTEAACYNKQLEVQVMKFEGHEVCLRMLLGQIY